MKPWACAIWWRSASSPWPSYVALRLLGKTRGAGLVRGLGLIVVGLFLVAQVVVVSFDLTVLGSVLDYLLTTRVGGPGGDFPAGVAARPDGAGPLPRLAPVRPRPASSRRGQAGRRRRGPVARVRRRPDRHRARDVAGHLSCIRASPSTPRCRRRCCGPFSPSAARCTTAR